ncbi:MAG: hypothetical protein IPJ88_14995 [Myxococcales bacterium]|nr:MAG: hypothetical protein IPJ88_14995 [Myxococcales bacterium]
MANAPKVIRLEDLYPRDWFKKAKESNPGLAQVCEVLGDHTTALSIICGVRITSITMDRVVPEASVIEFGVGEQPQTQELTFSEFRHRLLAPILVAAGQFEPLAERPNREDVQQFVGVPFLLMASVFGMKVLELTLKEPEPELLIEIEGSQEILSVGEFRDALCHALKLSTERGGGEAEVSLDLSKVTEAQAAFDSGDMGQVIELLGAWPAPLARLLRTPGGAKLSDTDREQLAQGLALLAEALVGCEAAEQHVPQELIRLAIQWVQDLPAAGQYYYALGVHAFRGGQQGSSIGLFRRAISSGKDDAEAYSALARSLLFRNRKVAALVCMAKAEKRGADPSELAELRKQAGEQAHALFLNYTAKIQ